MPVNLSYFPNGIDSIGPLYKASLGANQNNSTHNMGAYRWSTYSTVVARGGRMMDDSGDVHSWAGDGNGTTGLKTLDVGIYTLDTVFYACWCRGFRCAYDLN